MDLQINLFFLSLNLITEAIPYHFPTITIAMSSPTPTPNPNPLTLIAGGSGDIGSHLSQHLAALGHEVIVITRKPDPSDSSTVGWDDPSLINYIARATSIVNLAGENIWAKRWSTSRKFVLRQSRRDALTRLISLIKEARASPQVFLNASGIAYYGIDASREIPDESAPPGKGFLADLCRESESLLNDANFPRTRAIQLRVGITLSSRGVALNRLRTLHCLLCPMRIGLGTQWFSWVHIDDVAALVAFTISNSTAVGPYNITAPNPVTFDQLTGDLACRFRRPRLFPIPSLLVRLAMGKAAEVILNGSRVLPAKALSGGFTFRYPDLPSALDQLLDQPAS